MAAPRASVDMPAGRAYVGGTPPQSIRKALHHEHLGTPRPAAIPPSRGKLVLVWAATVLVLLAVVIARASSAPGRSPGRTSWPARRPSGQEQPAAAAPATQAPRAAVDLHAEIQRIIAENPDHRIGVVLADTHDGQPRSYGDGTEFMAASTAKVMTAAAYYHLVETGEKSLDAPLGSFDAAFQLKAMINTSSDDSWLLLMQDIGYPKLIDYAATIGITYDPEQNLLTPADMAELLKQLSTGKLLNAEHTAGTARLHAAHQ